VIAWQGLAGRGLGSVHPSALFDASGARSPVPNSSGLGSSQTECLEANAFRSGRGMGADRLLRSHPYYPKKNPGALMGAAGEKSMGQFRTGSTRKIRQKRTFSKSLIRYLQLSISYALRPAGPRLLLSCAERTTLLPGCSRALFGTTRAQEITAPILLATEDATAVRVAARTPFGHARDVACIVPIGTQAVPG
jgi:hypothetical protein